MKRSFSQLDTSTQHVVIFCELRQIQYLPIKLNLVPVTSSDGTTAVKKELQPDIFGFPKQTDFKDNPNAVKKRVERFKQRPEEYTHVAIDTRFIYQIDIDCEEYSDEIKTLLDTHPFTRSSTKSYGRHIFVNEAYYEAPKNRLQFKEAYGGAVELLSGQWAWCPLNEPVYNADASFDMMGLEAMIAETPTKKVKRNIKERPQMTPEQSDDIKKRIVNYIKDLPYERVRKCTINGFKEYDPNRFTWEVRLTAPDGYCPAKGGACNNDHSPTVVITPHWCHMDCFNASQNVESDCHRNKLEWALPENKSREFFKDYYNDYKSKYGINRNANIQSDDAFLASLFMHREGKRAVLCKGTWYVRNEYGLYKTPKDSMLKVVKDFFVEFQENSERLYHETNRRIQLHVQQGNKATTHADWKSFCSHKRVLNRLKSNSSRREILKEIRCEVTNNEFEDKLDSDPYLLGFENGVFDLNELKFRLPTLNEYVSMSCEYAFEPKSKDECQEWLDIFLKLYRSQEEMDFDWKEMARSLVGTNNKEEIAKFELGGGGNGKGFKSTAEQKALGDYCKPLSSSCVLKGKYTVRNGHDIALYSGRKARRWQFSEFHEADVLDTEQFKRYTGNDPIPMRTHQQKEMEYHIAPPITFSLNNPIRISGHTQRSIVRRVRCLPFQKTFVTQEEYDVLDESKRQNALVEDNTLKERLNEDGVKCIIMNILLSYYKRYKQEGLDTPASITEFTKTFLENVSPETKWLRDNLESSSGNIVMNDLLTYYNDQNGTCISKTKFKELLKSNHYETCNTSGITLVRQCEGYLETNSWKFGEKKKGICVKGVKIKNLDAVSSCQNDQSSSN